MFNKGKVNKKMVKAYCDDMLSYIESRRKNNQITKDEREVLDYFSDVVYGLLERMR